MKKNNKGFTLMEMLIVVAIIAILVAISIPVFTSQLEKARENTDIANLRAAKACAVTEYLTNDSLFASADSVTKYYDAVNGKLVDSSASITAYGKGTATPGGCDAYGTYNDTFNATGKIITVAIAKDGTVTVEFA